MDTILKAPRPLAASADARREIRRAFLRSADDPPGIAFVIRHCPDGARMLRWAFRDFAEGAGYLIHCFRLSSDAPRDLGRTFRRSADAPL